MRIDQVGSNLNYAILFVWICLSSFSATSVFAQNTDRAECLLSGRVLDLQDAVVPGKVILRKGTVYLSTTADQTGNFQFKVEPGSYEILIVKGLDFWNYLRSEIKVTCKLDVSVNLYVLPECVSYGCDRLGAHFDVFTNKKSRDSDVVVAYFDHREQEDSEVYSNVVLTFNEITVRAKEIEINKKTKKVVARDGWMESGLSRQTFTDYEINIAGSSLIADLKRATILDKKNIRRLKKLYSELKLVIS
jgi:hypothetical protein